MKGFIRFILYAGLMVAITFCGYDNYKLYLQYNKIKATEEQTLQDYNNILIERDVSKPKYNNNLEIASAIIKAQACSLTKCYLHLKDSTDVISIEHISDISSYSNIEYIEYVILSDSDTGLEAIKQLDIPVNDVVINESIIILSVPSLEI